MRKPKYNANEVQETIDYLFNNPELTYEETMQKHGNVLGWARGQLKENRGLQERLLKIKRHSLILSVKKLAEEESIKLEYIQDKHPGLERIARQLYFRSNGKSPWQQAVEDAGLQYPSITRREWNLRKLINEVSSLEEEIKAIGQIGINKKDSGIVRASVHHLKSFGKAAIVSGIDFLHIRQRLEKRHYTFSIEELRKIYQNETLNEEEKAKYLFNTLALQFYPWNKNKSRIEKRLNDNSDSFLICQEKEYLDKKLESRLEQNKDDLASFRVSISLKETISKFQNAVFYFSGDKAGLEASNFYANLNDTLKGALS